MDRRTLLVSATALAAAATQSQAHQTGAHGDAGLKRLCADMAAEILKASPFLCTTLGVDKGPYAAQKSRFEGVTPTERAAYVHILKSGLRRLQGISRAGLSGPDRITYDTLSWQWSVALNGAAGFDYGVVGPGVSQVPYAVSHLNGAAQSFPDFMDSDHLIETRSDAEAYLDRLARFGPVLQSETDQVIADAGRGCSPPDFALQRALTALNGWISQKPEDNVLITSLRRRTAEKGIAGNWGDRAQALVDGPIKAALAAQIAALQGQLASARRDAGVWTLKNGEAYYAHMVAQGTSTQLNPDAIHKLGLEKVAELSARADSLLKAQGLSQGAVGERLAALYTDPRFIAPDTEAGRAQVLNNVRALVARIYTHLPDLFSQLPKAQLIVRRPPPINEGASPAYYLAGTVDGSRPGAYYLPLAHTGANPSWTLTSLTCHEAVPGHHLQNSLLIEDQAMPLLRKLHLGKAVSDFNAYDEGWALYSEQLGDEMGLYKDDPFGQIGYVDDALFRATRLVVDTGLHHYRWSREKAVDYMTGWIGKRTEAEIEIDRYCVSPGQALGYMIGKLKWLDLRARMQAKQGGAFDIKQFHAIGLGAGSTSLDALEQAYKDGGYI